MPQEATGKPHSAAAVASNYASQASPACVGADDGDYGLRAGATPDGHGAGTNSMGVKHAKAALESQGLSTEATDILIGIRGATDSRGRLGFPNPSNLHIKTSPKGLAQELNRSREQWPQKHISVIKLKSWIDKKVTSIDESSTGVLKYKTPHFRSSATVEIPVLEDGDRLQLGWIQTCVNMRFVNTYGNEGLTSWEFPEIINGKHSMISDADGKAYPWYGAKKELRTLKGPSDKQIITVEMNDNFFPQVTWHIPEEGYDRKPRLTHIHRKQRFYTCLAVRDCNQNRIFIYKTITWSMELNVKVNPERPLGERAVLVGPIEQEVPKILRKNIQLPIYALKAPNANRSQVLVWRPFHGEPKIVVPPIETTVDMDDYLNSTQCYGDKFAVGNHES